MGNNGFIQFQDISKVLRSLSTAKITIDQAVATALADAVMIEFERLAYETPQWTGTAAASWNLGFGASSGGDVRVQTKRTRAQALRAGHSFAPQQAIIASSPRMAAFKDTGYRTGNLVIWNDAISSLTAEKGPLRPENDPPGVGTFEDFKKRVQEISVKIHKDIVI